MIKNTNRIEALKVVAAYTGLAALWIFSTDQLLSGIIDDPGRMLLAQTIKGVVFIVATALLLYLLIRRMEKRLQLFDEHYRAIFHANPVPMWIFDLDSLRIRLANSAAQRHYGYSEREFVQLTIKDLRPPDDVPRLLEAVEKLKREPDRHTESCPSRHRRKDGSVIWVDIQTHQIRYESREARLVLARDITHHIAAQETLELNAEVFENIQEGIMVCDRDNRLILVNRAFESITGYSRDEVIGKNPNILSSGRQSKAFYQNLWHTLQEQGQWQGEVWNRRKDGHIYPERLSISTITNPDGTVQRYIGIFSDISEEKRAEARIEYLANYNPLTNLPNRNLMIRELEQALEDARKNQSELAILVVDLDRFKHINDGLGYETGNQLLIEIAHRLTEIASEADSVYHQSGDEFALLLPERNVQQAAHMADEIRRDVSRPFDAGGQQVSFTTSIGIAYYPRDGDDAAVLIQRADSALSRAKHGGRDAYQFFDQSSQNQSLEFMTIESGLRQAIDNDELMLHYQPQYDARTRRICGFETLIRWRHPEWGLVPPARFIPVAEESGQIIELGQWVLTTAAEQALSWHREYNLTVPVAINISVKQFRREDFVEQIQHTLERTQLPPELLCLEITESVAMAGTEFNVQTIERLHSLGVGIAIDDFGSGYSSLNYLKRLKVDKLKIDQGFVHDIGEDRRDSAIVETIIRLAHSLGFSTMAEGVETEAQYHALCAMDCDEIQGYYFARPEPATAVRRLFDGAALS